MVHPRTAVETFDAECMGTRCLKFLATQLVPDKPTS